MRYLLGLVLGLFALAVLAPAANAADLDCSDFSTQAQAQKHLTPGDPHGLDADGDGKACDSLPCPCSSGSGGGGGSGGSDRPKALVFRAWVVDVVDGDTIDVRRLGSRKMYRVRLVGIDTPEVYGGKECGGEAASRRLRLMAKGFVRVRTDPTQPKRDRYNRLLAYVSKGRKDLNKRMISLGLAKVNVVGQRFSAYRSYKRAQVRARAARRGTWGMCGHLS